ncbi:MAG: GTP 3',8-cyclase MoaA, partial [Candidatus Hydrogenedentes bacterium]|nr:GTP 3',8-cyclase MoaA [Candidatus Hydrogenedentota bacterium]
LDEEVFGAMNGRNVHPADVLAGIDAAHAAALDPVKINVVVQRGVNDHTLVDLAERFRFSDCIVRFIEFMDVGTLNGWNYRQVLPSSEVVRLIHERFPLEPLSSSYAGEVAERYRYCDGAGEIGVISSVSQPFCGDCTRLRLSSAGALYTWLFAGRGADVKQLLRYDADDVALTAFMRDLWTARTDRYSEERAAHAVHEPKVEMYHIGG